MKLFSFLIQMAAFIGLGVFSCWLIYHGVNTSVNQEAAFFFGGVGLLVSVVAIGIAGEKVA